MHDDLEKLGVHGAECSILMEVVKIDACWAKLYKKFRFQKKLRCESSSEDVGRLRISSHILSTVIRVIIP